MLEQLAELSDEKNVTNLTILFYTFHNFAVILLVNSPTMQALRTLETAVLMDMLTKYTIVYTRMLTDGSTQEEYLKYKEAIKAIQLELELRRNEETGSPDLDSKIPTHAYFS